MDVRHIEDHEVDAWVEAMRAGFLGRPAAGEAAFRRQVIDLDRTLGAFDGDRVVGTLRSWGTDLSLPGGGTVPVAALTNVTVTATHRRRGLLTRMLGADLADARARGEAASVLIASEWPIYGRFGYGPATEHVTLTVDARACRFAVPTPGSVELVDAATFRAAAPAVFDAHRRRRAGELARPEHRWDVEAWVVEVPGRTGTEPFRALCRDEDGRIVGSLLYRTDRTWDERVPRITLEVIELMAEDPAAAARLWRYCTEIDWVTTVKAEDRPPDDPLPFQLADARAVRQTHRADLLWLRVLDVPQLLTARRYAVDGEVVLDVADALGLAGGTYRLVVRGGAATCEPTDAAPGLRLPVSALGAVSLGGTSLVQLADAGAVTELAPGSLLRADLLFRWHRAPWCATWF